MWSQFFLTPELCDEVNFGKNKFHNYLEFHLQFFKVFGLFSFSNSSMNGRTLVAHVHKMKNYSTIVC